MDILQIGLLFAGALGSVAQSLLTNEGALKLPARSDDGKSIQMGILADCLIGATGALAALVVGLVILSRMFFIEDTQGGSPIGQIPTWVRLFSFGALAGIGSRRLLPALSDKLVNAITGEVNRKVEAAKQAIVEQAEARSEVLRVTVDQLAGATKYLSEEPKRTLTASASANPLQDLASLVMEYDQINEPDYRKRVAAKDDVANRMLSVIIRNGITREQIEGEIAKKSSEAYVLALASFIASNPSPGDGSRLLIAGEKLTLKHVMYRLVLTLTALAMRDLLSPEEKKKTTSLLVKYLDHADASLERRIRSTLDSLKTAAN